MSSRTLYRVGLVAAGCLTLAACAQDVPPHMKPLGAEAMHLMGERGMSPADPIFIRIFKAESELEVWKQRSDGRFYHFKTYPICNWSGDLGPKLKQGDKQAPEGFYTVSKPQMNPNSSFHLSFNLGYPNKFDASHKRTGAHLMVHGDCRSAGCYAMTDSLVEEIYALAREALNGGQEAFHVHALPFRMTDANMERFNDKRWQGFWTQLKVGYDHFELTRQTPKVAVCNRSYLVNAEFVGAGGRVSATGPCPTYRIAAVSPFTPIPHTGRMALGGVVVPGRKRRDVVRERGLPPIQSRQASQNSIGSSTFDAPMGLTGGGVIATYESSASVKDLKPDPIADLLQNLSVPTAK